MRNIFRLVLSCLVTGSLLAPTAYAHHMMGGKTPDTFLTGLLSGLGHPVIGPDHLCFTIGVGFAAAATRRPFLLPLIFVLATIAGAVLHVLAVDLPYPELMIILSLVGAGGLLALYPDAPIALWGTLFAAAGLFHGYAYGESIVGSEPTPLGAYFAGFAVIQYVIALGVALLASRSFKKGVRALRIGGGLIASIGALLFFGLMPSLG